MSRNRPFKVFSYVMLILALAPVQSSFAANKTIISTGSAATAQLPLAATFLPNGKVPADKGYDPGIEEPVSTEKLALPSIASGGDFVWAKSLSGSIYGISSGNSIAVDSNGDIYTTGAFTGTVDFDPGPEIFTLTSAGFADIFISKLDNSGNLIWVKRIGGTSGEVFGPGVGIGVEIGDVGNGIVVDTNGNVYTTGSFQGTVDFDPGPGINNLASNGFEDIFISKLNGNGDFVWAKSMGAAMADYGNGIAIDLNGNLLTTGTFRETTDFDPGAGITHLTSAGGSDVFVSKLSSNGDFIWAGSMGGEISDWAGEIAVDSSGSVYTTGTFFGTADFDPGSGANNQTSAGGSDIFLAKLDSSGGFVWAKTFGGTDYDQAIDIAVQPGGNVYMTGRFNGTANFDLGAGTNTLTSEGDVNGYIAKLDGNGDFIWTINIGGAGGASIDIDPNGNVLTSGSFSGTVDFDPGAGTFTLTADAGELFISKLDSNGDFVWASNGMAEITTENPTGDSNGKNIAVDSDSNIYITGNFHGTVDFDPGLAVSNMTSASYDVFITKSNNRGVFQWAYQMRGGNDSSSGNSIAEDSSGNIYTMGSYSGTVDFDPGPGTFNLTSTEFEDIYISKLDSNGDFLWAQRIGGGSDASLVIINARSFAVNSSGIYILGTFEGVVDFDPGTGISNLAGQGGTDIFLCKLDSNGNFIWAKSMGGTEYDNAIDIALDPGGNIYTTGTFQGTADFDPGPGTADLVGLGSFNLFVSKLDASGNFLWAKTMGGAGANTNSITADSNGVYTTGRFWGTADFDPGAGISNLTGGGMFISKLDSNGDFVWARNMEKVGGADYDGAISSGLALDTSGNIYTVGSYSGTVDFDPGAGTSILTSAGLTDIFISKLDSSGNFVWAKTMGGTYEDWGASVATDSNGNVYTTGSFQDTADFDPGTGTFNLTSTGFADIFISKLDPTGGLLWARSMGGSDLVFGTDIAIDANGVFTTGSFRGTADFDPGIGTYNLTSPGGNTAFISKLLNDSVEVPDIVDPTVNTIVRGNASPTSSPSITFTVTFSEDVSGVSVSDFVLTKTGTISGESVTIVSGGPTIFTVSVNTGSGNGDLRLDIPVGASITDLSGNPLDDLPYISGESYTVIKSPRVASGLVQRQGMPASPDLSPNSMICSSVTAIGAETFGPFNTVGNGTIQFSDLPIGTYKFQAVYPGYLTSEKDDVSVSATTINLGTTTLRGGDVNGDHAINIYDVVKIVNKFGQTGVAVTGANCSDPDEAADINNDGVVNIRDLTITTGNWGLVSPLPWQP